MFEPFFNTNDPVFDSFFNPAYSRRDSSTNKVYGFRTDIYENDHGYTLDAELPGYDKSDISVDVKDDVLTIVASHPEPDENTAEPNYIRHEISKVTLQRKFNIEGIDASGIRANYKNGILSLDLPKVQPKEPEKIDINID